MCNLRRRGKSSEPFFLEKRNLLSLAQIFGGEFSPVLVVVKSFQALNSLRVADDGWMEE